MPGATLLADRNLTVQEIARRIRAGLPSFSTTADGTGTGPRLPLPPLTLEKRIQDTGALYSEAQVDLVTWSEAFPGAIDPPDFGSQPDDLSGTNTDRTVRAIKSFQVWAAKHGAQLRQDGTLDSYTHSLLQRVAQDAAARHFSTAPPAAAPAAKSSSLPLVALAGGALALALALGWIKL